MEIGVPCVLYTFELYCIEEINHFSRRMRIFLPLRIHQSVQKVSVLFIIQTIYMDETVR